ncbi:hypothetical protein HDU89_006597 [Geranomyces variabilis]|nr:hypothetical protein HDU89_006597 [Geranomyces variabilis]
MSVAERARNADGEVRFAVLTDPQLTDAYSYGQRGLPLALTQLYSDIYMKRNFKALQTLLHPDAIFVLGDMMDGAREWLGARQDYFPPELARLQSVFKLRDPSTPMFWAAGNHDIGYGNQVIPAAYDRYRATFGGPNYSIELANQTIIVLDTVSLSASVSSPAYDAARAFLDSLNGDARTGPRILVTHIPLYRPNGSPCGSKRGYSRMIDQGRGYQYQNLVVESLSREILDKIRPTLVLSGDDHDWCEYTHTTESYSAVELTVATFSWLQGNHYPGFALLTLTPPSSTGAHASYSACALLPQMLIYAWYAAFAIVTIVAAAPWWARYRRRQEQTSYVEIPLFTSVPTPRRGASPRRRRVSIAGTTGLANRRTGGAGGWGWCGDARTARVAGRVVAETVAVGAAVHAALLIWDAAG